MRAPWAMRCLTGPGAWFTGLVLISSLGGCDSLLDVEAPGLITEDQLDDPALAETLANSVVAQVECSWDNYVAAAAHHSDEWVANSGNALMAQWGLRRVSPDEPSMVQGACEAFGYGLHTPLHGARVQAESHFERIQAFPDTEGKDVLMATVRAYGAWPLVAFSEGFCGTPLDGGDRVLSSIELAALAETRFTEALQLAQAVGRSDLEHLSRVGRARVRLTQEKYTEVISDGLLVPDEFTFVATRGTEANQRWNRHYWGVSGPTQLRSATIAPNYRALEWKGTPDPRVVVATDGTNGFGDFEYWFHTKVPSLDTPTLMASWREAQLFMAEAYAMTDQLPAAIAILDEFHSRAGLPDVTASDLPTQDDVIAHVIEERRREMLSEGGHRLRDHLRWRGTAHEVPFLGEPGSIHPNGRVLNPETGEEDRFYDDMTCIPVPSVEIGG